jgi:hypothetical protein
MATLMAASANGFLAADIRFGPAPNPLVGSAGAQEVIRR